MTVEPVPPRLSFAARLRIDVAAPLVVGETGAGLRRVINITGGSVEGARLSGRILPGGADFQIIRADGLTLLHARYVVETGPGEFVYIENSGLRHGPPEAMERIRRGEYVDPTLIYFRTTPVFETGAARHQWLTRAVFTGVGARYPDRVELDVFEIL